MVHQPPAIDLDGSDNDAAAVIQRNCADNQCCGGARQQGRPSGSAGHGDAANVQAGKPPVRPSVMYGRIPAT